MYNGAAGDDGGGGGADVGQTYGDGGDDSWYDTGCTCGWQLNSKLDPHDGVAYGSGGGGGCCCGCGCG